jgi:hypothetical protein
LEIPLQSTNLARNRRGRGVAVGDQAVAAEVDAGVTNSRPKRRTRNGSKHVKHGIKWLADNPHPRALGEYLRSAPKGVIKGIVNAALNLERGSAVHLSKPQKKFFAGKRRYISYLTDPKISLQKKRRALQTGGFIPLAVVAPILATVIGEIATRFLPKDN